MAVPAAVHPSARWAQASYTFPRASHTSLNNLWTPIPTRVRHSSGQRRRSDFPLSHTSPSGHASACQHSSIQNASIMYIWEINSAQLQLYRGTYPTDIDQRLRMSSAKQQIVIRRVMQIQRPPRHLFAITDNSQQTATCQGSLTYAIKLKIRNTIGAMCFLLKATGRKACSSRDLIFHNGINHQGQKRLHMALGLVLVYFYFLFYVLFWQDLTM